LQVPSEPGIVLQEKDPLVTFLRLALFLQNVLQLPAPAEMSNTAR
jgi:hypothetical protein